MEDVSKALLIGAGMFFAILIITLLVMSFNNISSFYNSKSDATVIEQTKKFNAQFTNYNRENLRGSELISFMNKVIDYNESQSYDKEKGYNRILVTIDMDSASCLKQFMHNESLSRNSFLRSSITNTNKLGGSLYKDDKQLVDITETPSQLIQMLKNDLNVQNASEVQLQQLSSKISSIILSTNGNEGETEDRYKAYRIQRADVIKDLLGIDIPIDENGITSDRTKLDKIRNIANIYNQYTWFKRAMFDCTELEYDTETNRVKKMTFKLQTKIENGKKRVIFD